MLHFSFTGQFPLGNRNIMSPEERARFLPVMRALLRVMETNNPSPSDINTLLVLTRDLTKYVPDGDTSQFGALAGQFGGFLNLEGIESMGIPETGDVVKTIDGQPHIITTFGEFLTN